MIQITEKQIELIKEEVSNVFKSLFTDFEIEFVNDTARIRFRGNKWGESKRAEFDFFYLVELKNSGHIEEFLIDFKKNRMHELKYN